MRPALKSSSRAVTGPDRLGGASRIEALLRRRLEMVMPPGTIAYLREAEGHARCSVPQCLAACIFDVDGVLLASLHERAWRETLADLAPPDLFTIALYQTRVAGRPRLDGARAALAVLGLDDSQSQAQRYADRKQARLESLIEAGCVTAYPDALRFLRKVQSLGWPVAPASLSKNVNPMMRLVHYGP